MPVNFTGGSSGNRTDAKPSVPSNGQSQPVVTTTTKGSINVARPSCNSTSPESSRGEANMPTGGTNPVDSNY
jgi:hypothetical protein